MKANKNITLMVVLTAVISVVFLLPRNIYNFHRYINGTGTNYMFSYITHELILFSYSLNIFVYYLFNKLFRKILCVNKCC